LTLPAVSQPSAIDDPDAGGGVEYAASLLLSSSIVGFATGYGVK
jgi:hypothetical protein